MNLFLWMAFSIKFWSPSAVANFALPKGALLESFCQIYSAFYSFQPSFSCTGRLYGLSVWAWKAQHKNLRVYLILFRCCTAAGFIPWYSGPTRASILSTNTTVCRLRWPLSWFFVKQNVNHYSFHRFLQRAKRRLTFLEAAKQKFASIKDAITRTALLRHPTIQHSHLW